MYQDLIWDRKNLVFLFSKVIVEQENVEISKDLNQIYCWHNKKDFSITRSLVQFKLLNLALALSAHIHL